MVLPKKKLLILVDWFVPGYKAGGPIKSCYNISLALKNDYEISVITSDTDHGEMEPYKNIQSNKWLNDVLTGVNIFYINRKSFTRKQYIDLINSVQADYIYLNHLYSPFFVVYPIYLKWRQKINGKLIVCPRGALHSGALAEKSLKKKIFLKLFKMLNWPKFIRFHATNEKEAQEILFHFPGSDVHIANNLSDLPKSSSELIPKTSGFLKLIYIARIAKIKNLHLILQALKSVKGNIDFTIAGPMEESTYWNDCNKIISELPENIKVKYLGAIAPSEVNTRLKESHLYVLPSNGENFGHSIFESFQNGRPVLISDRTPWKNLNVVKAGWDLSLDSIGAFRQALQNAVEWDQNTFDEYSIGAKMVADNYVQSPDLKESYIYLFS